MLVGSGKMTFEQRPERNNGSDCQVPYNPRNLSHGCVKCVYLCVCKIQPKPEGFLVIQLFIYESNKPINVALYKGKFHNLSPPIISHSSLSIRENQC